MPTEGRGMRGKDGSGLSIGVKGEEEGRGFRAILPDFYNDEWERRMLEDWEVVPA